jgi:hypothetical protein
MQKGRFGNKNIGTGASKLKNNCKIFAELKYYILLCSDKYMYVQI